MRRLFPFLRFDLILAAVLSLLIHSGIALGGEWLKAAPAPPETEPESDPIEVMIQPVIEPDEVVVTDIEMTESAGAEESAEPAPPMQADMPSVQIDSPFVQQMQPPPPQGLSADAAGAIRIPTTTTRAGLQKRSAQLFDLSDLDQPPVPTFRSRPVHPYELRRDGIEGKVLVEFSVDSGGDVIDAHAVKSSRREFESPAVQAVLKWKFRPGKKGGVPVGTQRIQVWINFNLN
ncbi:energy transducer TonB [Ruficoccus sp. ZRK36]|uniref:energy transducer TonB n=1 Tax=Ruficoccus sp. ZRK36 TaxID=2866311 RepID=UPI001C732ECF|nr:energy transducer TonB [Ruficoccus sp. ZRK36]QYY34629.1 TonB family protein [Ruficoccus sp. ZRK36]